MPYTSFTNRERRIIDSDVYFARMNKEHHLHSASVFGVFGSPWWNLDDARAEEWKALEFGETKA
jgi:hypothetical protein